MMASLLGENGLGIWVWTILAVLFLLAELLVPAFFFLWLGASAFLTGVIFLMVPGNFWLELFVFALLAVILVLLSRHRRRSTASDARPLNKRMENMVGNEFALSEAIENGRGHVRVGDSWWPVKGPDLPADTLVRITGTDGTFLIVEKAS